jgi:hypothetical protein
MNISIVGGACSLRSLLFFLLTGILASFFIAIAVGQEVQGTISGKAMRSLDAVGVSDAEIYFYNASWGSAGWCKTDSIGNYRKSLAPGNYYVAIYYHSLPGKYFENAPSQSLASPVLVSAGVETSNINFTLLMESSISGRVTRESDSSGIEGALVHVYFSSSDTAVASAHTDSSGYYRVAGLAAGSYIIDVSAIQNYMGEYYNNAHNRSYATYVTLAEKSETTDINFGLSPPSSISGRVTRDTTGSGIPNITIRAYNHYQNEVASATTNADGYYLISGLAADNYCVYAYDRSVYFINEYYNEKTFFSNATIVPVASSQDVSNINFGLSSYGMVSGRIVNDADGTGISGVSLRLYGTSCGTGNCFTQATGVSDINGYFTMINGTPDVGLSPGVYYLEAISGGGYLGEYYKNASSREAAESIVVENNKDITNITIGLTLGGSISGRVVRDSDGSAIINANVSLESASIFGSSSYTDSNGYYKMGGLAPGSYYVRVHEYYSTPYSLIGEYYNNSERKESATAVSVTAGKETTDINLSLAAFGSISGRITRDLDGSTISGIPVRAVNIATNSYSQGSTDAGGCFKISYLIPGNYTIESLVPSEIYLNEYYNNVADKGAATPVTVLPGRDTPNINMGLSLLGKVSGRVVRASDGLPVPGAIVYVTSSSYGRSNSTDSSGNYTVGGLLAGAYIISTSPSGYVKKYYNDAYSESSASPVLVQLNSAVTGIDISMNAGGSISGKLLRKYDGTPISNYPVQITDGGGGNPRSGSTDSSGNYVFSNLAPGNYFVSTPKTTSYPQIYYPDAISQGTATPVAVQLDKAAETINISVVDYGSISGKITADSDGTPVAYANIYVFHSSKLVQGYVAADGSGNYKYSGLETGNYYIYASSNLNFIREYYLNSDSLDTATPVHVELNAETRNIDISMTTGATISGKVTSDSSGVAISSIKITASRVGGGLDIYAYSDASGKYIINGLSTDSYYLKADSKSYYAGEYFQNSLSSAAATAVSVVQGTATTNVDFGLATGGTISGRVSLAFYSGTISDVSLQAYNSDWNPVGDPVKPYSGGNYTIPGIPAGLYFVKAAHDGTSVNHYISQYYRNSLSKDGASKVQVSEGVNTPNINFTMLIGSSIVGRVTRKSDGAGIQGVTIQAFTGFNMDDPDNVFTAITNTDGYYYINGLLSGKYFVTTSNNYGYVDKYYNDATDWGAAAVAVEQMNSTTNINFSLAAGGSISGRVIRDLDGGQIQKATITVFDASWDVVETTEADSLGNYTVYSLEPGSYYLQAFSPGFIREYYPNTPSRGDAIAVVVERNATTTNSDISLSEGGSISGKISRASDGAGIANASIRVQSASGEVIQSVSGDSAGYYAIAGLPSGSYYVATYNTPEYVDEYFENAYDRESAAAVNVAEGAGLPGININLDAGGAISGKVIRSANGAGIFNATVRAYDSSGHTMKYASTDSSGNYIIAGLAAGSYKVATYATPGFGDAYYNQAISASDAQAIAVTAGATISDINFTLAAAFSIEGSVVCRSDGVGIPGVQVLAYDANWIALASGYTDSAGYYSIEGLAAGDYYLQTYNTFGYVDEYSHNAFFRSNATIVTLIEDSRYINFSLKSGAQPVRDFNGDRKTDVLWRNFSTGQIYMWFMDGMTRIGGGSLQSVPDQNWKIVGMADFNRDGKSDILWRNNATGENYVWFMNGIDSTGGAFLDPVGLDWTIAGVADFNNDGKPDVLWHNVATGENFVWFMNGTIHVEGAYLASMGDVCWKIAGLGDFNKDGEPDILWRNRVTGENYVWFINGTTSIGGASLNPVPDLNWKIVAVEDYNGDGHADVLWRNSATGVNYVWLMNGVAMSEGVFLDEMADTNWLLSDKGECALGADFDGDENSDLLWRNEATGENYLWFMNGKESTGGAYLDPVPDAHWKVAGIADFNSDGRVDILWRNSSTGENYVWFMNGKTRTGGAYLDTVLGANWKVAATADFNKDGKPDILWRNFSTGENYVWFMDGATHSGGAYLTAVGNTTWKIVGTGDFNGNGKPEILWRNEATGENYVWYLEGTNLVGGDYIDPVGGSDWKVVGIADFNKDRKIDILWRNESTGENYVWYMNGIAHTGGAYLPPVAGQNWKIATASE